MAELTLLIDGQRFGGWTEVEVVRGIEQAAGSFRVGYTDRWDGQTTARPIEAGARVQVQMDGETVITGHVDRTQIAFGPETHSLTVEGRDAAGDLIDASAVHASGQWLNASLERIASDLALPFGVEVKTDTDTGEPFMAFALQDGETAHEAIERLARMRGLLTLSDGRGGVALTRAGRESAGALIEGENILSGRAEVDMKGRYSTYICRGQVQARDDFGAASAYRLRDTARDPGVNRYRPLAFQAEEQSYQRSMLTRAEWECRRRAARGARLYLTVQGWRDARRALWRPNTRSQVRSTTLGVSGEYLIAEVRQTLDDRGTLTELTLGNAAAYALDAPL